MGWSAMPSMSDPSVPRTPCPSRVPAHHVQARDARSEGASRTGEQLRRRALLDHPALLDHHDPVREQECVEHVVGHDDRGAVGQHLAQHLAYGGRDGDVERGHRLVEKQQPWVRREGSGNRDPLRLPSRELRGPAVGVRRGVDLAQPVLRDRARLAACLTRAARPEGDVVERGQVREQQRLLGQQRDPTRVWRDPDVRLPGLPMSKSTRPSSDAVPASGRSRPAITDMAVDLPEPFGPSTASVSPTPTCMDRSKPRSPIVALSVETHVAPRTRASPITTIATTTSSSDRATAASASLSRCR